jgi:hypothetical protein
LNPPGPVSLVLQLQNCTGILCDIEKEERKEKKKRKGGSGDSADASFTRRLAGDDERKRGSRKKVERRDDMNGKDRQESVGDACQ